MKTFFDNYNRELLKKLIPDKETPIYGVSFTDPNDPIFNKSFEEIKNEVIQEILKYQEFDLELEKIKNNLKIK